ncbi:hypothetical protein [Paraglaciecola sp. L3A3]|uniref:hypothetical protein n=1 Tax=Paraglaciecola sp. L3A3 TaxID=2686358 RepID=UPI00131C071A|nr:hypothetical protein [Paraglaciecola sp. L3A3]
MFFNEITLLFLGLIVGLLVNNYLPKYFGKKGENLATKEDITEITDKIESVKKDYAHQLEATRAELTSQLQNNSYRYEKEYSILESLTESLVDVRNCANRLRPVVDIVTKDKTEEEIKKERLQALHNARLSLYEIREKKRPFYPKNIYNSLCDIDTLAHSESVKYQYHSPSYGNEFDTYWEEAEKNQKEIAEKSNISINLVRERIVEWEKLPNI